MIDFIETFQKSKSTWPAEWIPDRKSAITALNSQALPQARTWASAKLNQRFDVTTAARPVTKADSNVLMPDRRKLA
jgi:hypothetical protein